MTVKVIDVYVELVNMFYCCKFASYNNGPITKKKKKKKKKKKQLTIMILASIKSWSFEL